MYPSWLTMTLDNWVTVPTNSTLTIHKQTVMIHPIIDQYYNDSPSYNRSSGFAVSKGLVSNAPGAAQALTPLGTVVPSIEEEKLKERLNAVQKSMAEVGVMV
jgi:glutamine amidotransferase